MNKPRFLRLASLVLLTASCGIMPGDYRVYRVAQAETENSPTCYGMGGVPPSEANDSTTFRTGLGFAIYAVDKETFILEVDPGTGPMSLEGSRDGKDYTFEGESVDVDPADPITTTSTTNVTIDATIKGKSIEGTTTVTTSTTYVGTGAPPASNCTTTTTWIGAEVNDVELQHGV
jgi:hypothetical protein